MARVAKTAKAEVATRRPAARKAAPTGKAKPGLARRLKEALEQQIAVSEILRVISNSPGDVKPMLNAVAEHALRLCDATQATIVLIDGDVLRCAAAFGGTGTLEEGEIMPLTRGSVASRAISDAAPFQIVDLAKASEEELPVGRELQRRIGHHTALAVPLMRADRAIGAIQLWRMEIRAFSEMQITLVRTFAEQAAIAIENVRLFKELETRNADLTEALEQQTATSGILRVISQSPTGVQPVFDTIVGAAMRLCGGSSANVLMLENESLHLAAIVTADPEGAATMRRAYPRPLGRDTVGARAVLDRNVAMVSDVLKDPDFGIRSTAIAGGFRSILAVPLVREGTPIGAIVVGRPAPGPFPDTIVELLKTFADQAVIAIENVRLFKELEARNSDLTEALEQQTATSDILRVISQSHRDTQPVFDTIVAAALNLCGATSVNVYTFDGALVHLAACSNVNPEYVEALRRFFPRPPSRDTAVLRAVQSGEVVVVPDVLADDEYLIGPHSVAGGFRSVLAVPLLRDGRPIGGIAVGRPDPGSFPAEQIILLQTFADQAVIAIENVRLFNEVEARTAALTQSVGELRALGEVGQAVSSTLDLETVLSTIVSRATQLSGMDAGAIYEYDEVREEFHLRAVDRYADDLVEALRVRPVRKGEGVLGRLAVVGEPVQVRNIMDEKVYQSGVRKMLIRLGYRSLLSVPLLREDRLIGGLVVNRKSAGEFAPQVIELLKTFATQSALAIQNARLFREIEDKGRQLEVASQHKSEFLANMSHELRTPLNAIIGFSEVLAERMFGEINDKQAEYLADILDSGRHLLGLINDILDLSKVEAGRMELNLSDFDLPTAVDNTLMLMRERAHRRAITLRRTIDEQLTTVRADERKVKQVLLNLLSNALKFTPEGGSIEVGARVRDACFEISVTDSGVGIAPEDQATVFEEFRQVGATAQNAEGTGLGLAISRKFIELHGGRIWVASEVGKGSTFAFTVPLIADPVR
jgi:two-component system, NtrC family, sensor kinase